MAKTNFQDPLAGRIISPHIAGLQEAISKIESALDIGTAAETDIGLNYVLSYDDITGEQEHKIYQAPLGKRNWLFSPAPVIKKNGSVISSGFTIEYGGGAIILNESALETDVFTADASHTTSSSVLDNGVVNIPSISFGANTISNAGKVAIPPIIDITGAQQINLLGKDGNCEDLSKWSTYQATLALDSTNKVFGANGIKITLNTTGGTGCIQKLSGIALGMVATKYYMVSAYIKNGNLDTNGLRVYSGRSGSGSGGLDPTSAIYIDSTKFTRVAILIQPSDWGTWTDRNIGVYAYGSNGTYGYVDGIMLNEISAAEYAAGVATCLANHPYNDSYSALQNLYFENRRYNMIRNGNTEDSITWWNTFVSTGTGILNVANGKFMFVSTADSAYAFQKIPVKANTNYYISCNVTGTNARMRVLDNTATISLKEGIGSFNTGSLTGILIVMQCLSGGAGGTGYFDSIMLIEGTSAPSAYKSCDIQRFALECMLTGEDKLHIETGKLSGLLWWKHKTLYGKDYGWLFMADATGYKIIATPWIGDYLKDALVCGVKYDGSIIGSTADYYSNNNESLYPDTNPSNNAIYAKVPDSVTGFTESLNPNNDEVKVFMNGWKAIWYISGRYVCWLSVVDGTPPSGARYSTLTAAIPSGTTVLPVADGTQYKVGDIIFSPGQSGAGTIQSISGNNVTMATPGGPLPSGALIIVCDDGVSNTSLLIWCKNNIAPGYEGYQLHYKLQNPEPVTDENAHINGEIWSLVPGDNYVTVDSGIVLGEIVNPTYNSGDNAYWINSVVPLNLLKNKQEAFKALYKNTVYDTSPLSISTSFNPIRGVGSEGIPAANFDANATYTIDYKILATMAPQIIGSLVMSYAQDVFSAITGQGKVLEQKQQHNSALDMLIDASMYEIIDSAGQGLLATALSAYGHLYINVIIPISPKRVKKPMVTINSLSITKGQSSTGTVDVTSVFTLGAVKYYGTFIILQYYTSDATTMSDIKSYGVVVDGKIIIDCRGRV